MRVTQATPPSSWRSRNERRRPAAARDLGPPPRAALRAAVQGEGLRRQARRRAARGARRAPRRARADRGADPPRRARRAGARRRCAGERAPAGARRRAALRRRPARHRRRGARGGDAGSQRRRQHVPPRHLSHARRAGRRRLGRRRRPGARAPAAAGRRRRRGGRLRSRRRRGGRRRLRARAPARRRVPARREPARRRRGGQPAQLQRRRRGGGDRRRARRRQAHPAHRRAGDPPPAERRAGAGLVHRPRRPRRAAPARRALRRHGAEDGGRRDGAARRRAARAPGVVARARLAAARAVHQRGLGHAGGAGARRALRRRDRGRAGDHRVMDEGDLLALHRRLVAMPSVSGQEATLAGWLEDLFWERGLRPLRLGDTLLVIAGDDAAAGAADLPAPRPLLLLDTHLDTVPPAPGWTRDPFTPESVDGRVFGLGSNDAKASVAAMTAAFLALARTQLPFALGLALVEAEETRGTGTKRALEDLASRGVPLLGAVFGEPTRLDVAVAQKGLLLLELEARGESCHAANADALGVPNAALVLARDLLALAGAELAPRHARLGATTVQPTVLRAGEARNVVPAQASAVLDVRTTPAMSHGDVVARVRERVASDVRVLSDRLEPRETDEGALVVRAARAA